jgi:hypothetical protein
MVLRVRRMMSSGVDSASKAPILTTRPRACRADRKKRRRILMLRRNRCDIITYRPIRVRPRAAAVTATLRIGETRIARGPAPAASDTFFEISVPFSAPARMKRRRQGVRAEAGLTRGTRAHSGPMEEADDAIPVPAGEPSIFGVASRILMSLEDHRPRRRATMHNFPGSRGGLESPPSEGRVLGNRIAAP